MPCGDSSARLSCACHAGLGVRLPFANRSFFVSDSILPLPSVVLFAGDEDGTVRVWNTEAGTGVYTFRHVHGSQKMTSMCFDTELRRLITRSVGPTCCP